MDVGISHANSLDDPQRLAKIEASGLLDIESDPAFDRLTELVGTMLDVQQSTLCIVLPDHQYFTSRWDAGEPGERQTPISHSYCQYVVTRGEPLAVSDAREHPLLRENPAIDDYDAIAYLGYPLTNSDGIRFGTVCVIDHKPRVWTDEDMRLLRAFTGVVAAEIEMRKTRAAAAQGVSRDFFDAAVHELRTPLASIAGFASTLTRGWDGFPDAQRLEFISIIDGQAQRLSRLVDDLLMQSRIESGHLQPMPEPVRLFPLMQEVARGFPDLEAQVHGDQDATAYVDRGQTEQVMVNLVSNAAKYGSSPVTLEVNANGHSMTTVRIFDSGTGVPPEFQADLFERYSQARGRRYAKGSGLGLWIVRALTRANGGSCRYEQATGRGATFVVELPSLAPHG